MKEIKATTVRVEGANKFCTCCGKVIEAGSEAVSRFEGRELFATDCFAANTKERESAR